MRPNGFWNRGTFRLVRDTAYGNERCVRVWTPPDADKGVWVWALSLSDLAEFYEVYGDRRLQTVTPRRDARAWAIAFGALDAYVCGRTDQPPTFEAFDPQRHLVRRELRWARDPFGSFLGHQNTWFEIPWAVFVEGPMRRRRTHRPRW